MCYLLKSDNADDPECSEGHYSYWESLHGKRWLPLAATAKGHYSDVFVRLGLRLQLVGLELRVSV